MENIEIQAIMEAVIYVADDPVKSEQFKEVFPDESLETLEQALKSMVENFNARPGGMMIREVAGGYRMTTRPEHHEQIRAYLKTRPNAKLSMAALETLAVIAYKRRLRWQSLAIRAKVLDGAADAEGDWLPSRAGSPLSAGRSWHLREF
jgi:chromosome segregation and condensation protein ScpB